MKQPYPIFAICIILVIATASVMLSQPQQSAGVISGIVIDSSTSEPLENVIVFIPNSGIGTSTGADGGFTLPRLPPGDYDLIVSRVGFHRGKLHLSLGKDDSPTIVLPLTAHPVRAPGVEVYAGAEIGPEAAPLFFPDGGENSWCAYGSETEIPVGILFAGRTMYMYALETSKINGEEFVGLWLLVYNGSEDTMIFDAGQDLRLDITAVGRTYHNVRSESLTARTGDGTDSAMVSVQFRPVERTFGVMAAQSTLFLAVNDRFDRAGGGPFLGKFAPPERPAGINPRHLKGIYDKCTHDGILRQYRIYPASGVDGIIRFPLPGFDSVESERPGGRDYSYSYEFVLRTPSGQERIVFTAH